MCASTSVGRCSRSTSHAVVALLPVPVAPSSTVCRFPARTRRASSLMAAGWSPDGTYSLTTSKRLSKRGMSSAMTQPYAEGMTTFGFLALGG